jgi:hypothetical protein
LDEKATNIEDKIYRVYSEGKFLGLGMVCGSKNTLKVLKNF